MATIRQRANGTWQVTIRRSILPKPHYATFDTEEEARHYSRRLEQLLDRGVIPEGLQQARESETTVGQWVDRYLRGSHVSVHDSELLGRLAQDIRTLPVTRLDVHWVLAWIQSMKREDRLAPGTIRKKVGALARCLDWCVLAELAPSNPFRQLPKKYASYTSHDGELRADVERDRRLEPGEEDAIRRVLSLEKPSGRERPIDGKWIAAWEGLFQLAIETAMRLREMYTLSLDQVDLEKRTVFLDKTKNGDKRQVPLSSVAVAVIKHYLSVVEAQEGGMEGFHHEDGRLFPWWDGSQGSLSRTTSMLSAKWRRIAHLAGCDDLRFHDLRHEATCRLYERTTLTDVQIARITGHRTLATLKRYASLRGSDLVGNLW